MSNLKCGVGLRVKSENLSIENLFWTVRVRVLLDGQNVDKDFIYGYMF